MRGIGGFWSVEIVKDIFTKEPFPVVLRIASRLQKNCLGNGVTVMGVQGCADGYIGDHISLAPSFVVTRIDIMEICTKVVKSIEELRQELISEGNL